MVFLDLSCINPIRHMSPRWGFRGFGVLVFYTHIAPLGLQKNSSCYTHCAPLERGDWTYRRSIDILLLWSEERGNQHSRQSGTDKWHERLSI